MRIEEQVETGLADMTVKLLAELDALRLEAFSHFHKNDKVQKSREVDRLPERIDFLDDLIRDHADFWAEAEVSCGNHPVLEGQDEADAAADLAQTLLRGSWFRLLESYFCDGSTRVGAKKRWDRRQQSELFLSLAVLRAVDGVMALDRDADASTALAKLCCEDARRSIDTALLWRDGFDSRDAKDATIQEREERHTQTRQEKGRKAARVRHEATGIVRDKIRALAEEILAAHPGITLARVASMMVDEIQVFRSEIEARFNLPELQDIEGSIKKYLYRNCARSIVPPASS